MGMVHNVLGSGPPRLINVSFPARFPVLDVEPDDDSRFPHLLVFSLEKDKTINVTRKDLNTFHVVIFN